MTDAAVTTDNVTATSLDFGTSALSVSSTQVSDAQYSEFKEFNAIAIAVSTLGIIANGFLTFVMIKSNRSMANTTNVLIANQCLIDTIYSLNVFLCYFRMAARLVRYNDPPTTLDTFTCLLIDGGTAMITCSNCSTNGLVAITLERYFKVVHPIGHRRYYRTWITPVIIVVTWIVGILTYALPGMLTTKILYGSCYITAVWPSSTVRKAFGLFSILWTYIIPIIIFVACYRGILMTVRRQQLKVAQHVDGTIHQPIPVDSVDNTSSTDGAARTAGKISKKASRTEMHITVTMIAVSACFAILMLPSQSIGLIQIAFQVNDFFSGAWHTVLASCGYAIPIINPFIYALRLDEVKRTWQAVKRQLT